MRDLSRLLRPKTIAVVGGGAWCRAVQSQLKSVGFQGDVWHVHPKSDDFKSITDLPSPPDAAFVGINRDATIQAIEMLSQFGAGGAVCFASGFAEVKDGGDRNAALLDAAGAMPVLGPNCYGMINAFDGALLWPDQHGVVPTKSGIAILTQSSNIAINLTMQSRGLPIGYVITCGNQAQTTQADIALALLDDPRVTAIGLHIEGFGDIAKWQLLARKAREKNVPLIALKVGKSIHAQAATISHTASLAGSDAGATSLLSRLGIGQVNDLSTFLEALKILHVTGPIEGTNIATISCSGGEASLAADLAHGTSLRFPPLNAVQHAALFAALGPKVALANPLDYHTYIWRDKDAMEAAFFAMLDPCLALTLIILDFPRADRCDASDWDHAINAILAAKARSEGRIAVVSTLPELLPEAVSAQLMAGGVIPLCGLREALDAIVATQSTNPPDLWVDMCSAPLPSVGETLSEAEAKTALATLGLKVPKQVTTSNVSQADLSVVDFPVVLKGQGIAHKTEAGAVALNLQDAQSVQNAALSMPADSFLIEEMITGGLAELLIGVVKDPAHGFVMTIGAGGTLTELLQDTNSVLIPSSRQAIAAAIDGLKIAKLLNGYRGSEPVKMSAVIDAVMAVQDYVLANATHVEEIEINPLICTPTDAVAADALIRTNR